MLSFNLLFCAFGFFLGLRKFRYVPCCKHWMNSFIHNASLALLGWLGWSQSLYLMGSKLWEILGIKYNNGKTSNFPPKISISLCVLSDSFKSLFIVVSSFWFSAYNCLLGKENEIVDHKFIICHLQNWHKIFLSKANPRFNCSSHFCLVLELALETF